MENIVFASKVLFLALIYASTYEFCSRNWVGERWAQWCASIVVFSVIASQIASRLLGMRSYDSPASFPSLGGVTSAESYLACAVPLFLLGRTITWKTALALVLILTADLATLARTSFIALCAALALALLTHFRHGESGVARLRTLVILGSTIAVAAVLLTGTDFGKAFQERLKDANVTGRGTASGRTVFVPIAVRHMQRRNLYLNIIGEGFGPIRAVIYSEGGMEIGAHNNWVDIAFALGAVGLAFFLQLSIKLFRVAIRARLHKASAVAAVTIFLAFTISSGAVLDPNFCELYAAVAIVSVSICGGRNGRLAQRVTRPTYVKCNSGI